ncbi:hypothetical protein ACWT_3969 [Actinoplanes sp. SE50]|uniref:hypothetical protein n=1 Tax=unclassified Actinoplanes TaxID=2626549 RepID=UPI00023ED455|nr:MULTISPECIES: hypothetical protein [unclassified Actinoplanes]AEV84993.1 hypothetical protein ACPL_4098 [Actinoplanes sp. SE50/110]ATO83384.1 hypothetical protein ACWT_3969 [Actinoplanes sp. SE50]SLM00791.1 hypothetical protein ACSP50_4024 [Actinoplanes sp. SE50/110]
MDLYGTEPEGVESEGMGAAPSVAKLLLELRGRTTVDVKPVGRSIQIRPQGARNVAVHIHPGGVDIAVARNQADEVAATIFGATVKDPDDPVPFVSVEGHLIDTNYDAILAASVQAVELRKAGGPAKAPRAAASGGSGTPRAASTRSAAPKATKSTRPAPRPDRPICPRCKQYELLASGECPSGYC